MKRIATFYIDGCLFGLDTSFVNDILAVPPLVAIPQNTSQFFNRIMRLKDTRVIHVVNTEKLLGLSNKPVSEDSRMLVLRSDGPGMGLLADSVGSLLDVAEDTVGEALPLSTIKREFLAGIVTDAEKVIVLLNAEKIVQTLEPSS